MNLEGGKNPWVWPAVEGTQSPRLTHTKTDNNKSGFYVEEAANRNEIHICLWFTSREESSADAQSNLAIRVSVKSYFG